MVVLVGEWERQTRRRGEVVMGWDDEPSCTRLLLYLVTWTLTGHFDFGQHFIFLQGKKERRQAANLHSLGGEEARVIRRG